MKKIILIIILITNTIIIQAQHDKFTYITNIHNDTVKNHTLGEEYGALYYLTKIVSDDGFIKLFNKYEYYCNQLVSDTIIQTGIVTRSYIPVVDTTGKICKYIYRDWNDTTWNKTYHKEYSVEIYYDNTLYLNGDWIYGIDTYIFDRQLYIYCDNEKQVHREHIKLIPREKPTAEGFIEWYINNNKIIK